MDVIMKMLCKRAEKSSAKATCLLDFLEAILMRTTECKHLFFLFNRAPESKLD